MILESSSTMELGGRGPVQQCFVHFSFRWRVHQSLCNDERVYTDPLTLKLIHLLLKCRKDTLLKDNILCTKSIKGDTLTIAIFVMILCLISII